MITKQGIVTTALLTAACLVPGQARAEWHSDTFKSPTGNLICKYRYAYNRISCGAVSSQKVITLGRYSRPVQGARISWDAGTAFPVLQYGWSWNLGQPISCRSLYSGMRCQNAAGWYFKIDRDRIYVGRYGTALYWL